MISFLSSWVKNLCLALIVVSILEMILPNNKTKKYVKMVMGMYILFSIIAPFVENKNELKFDVENLYRQYSTETSAITEVVDQTTMDSKLNELYEEKIEKNIIQKIEELGYEIDSCNVKAHISDQDTGIEQIFIRCNLDENEIETVKKFIIQEYGVNEKCLRIS